MAKSKTDDVKTVTLYSPQGTKVTVSEEQAKRLAGYTSSDPKKTSK